MALFLLFLSLLLHQTLPSDLGRTKFFAFLYHCYRIFVPSSHQPLTHFELSDGSILCMVQSIKAEPIWSWAPYFIIMPLGLISTPLTNQEKGFKSIQITILTHQNNFDSQLHMVSDHVISKERRQRHGAWFLLHSTTDWNKLSKRFVYLRNKINSALGNSPCLRTAIQFSPNLEINPH